MTTRTKSNFFKPGDFQGWGMHETPDDESPSVSEWCAEQANAILKAEIEKSVKVYGRIGTYASSWSTYPPGTFIQENNTHKAVLLFIEELKHDKSEGEE